MVQTRDSGSRRAPLSAHVILVSPSRPPLRTPKGHGASQSGSIPEDQWREENCQSRRQISILLVLLTLNGPDWLTGRRGADPGAAVVLTEPRSKTGQSEEGGHVWSPLGMFSVGKIEQSWRAPPPSLPPPARPRRPPAGCHPHDSRRRKQWLHERQLISLRR